jgi:GNAT superfamily N-acetyltransferase
MSEVTTAVATELDPLLPLIAGYQRFYGAAPDDARNRAFFSRLIGANEIGTLLEARVEGEVLGFATLYWSRSSVSARDVVLLNDLFVIPEARSRGVGRALIAAAAEVARGRGAGALSWVTHPDNSAARRLYDSLGATAETWVEYTLELDPREVRR